MAKRAEKKPPVWKDTDKYPFSIQYSYPLAIRNRCLFFWATTLKGWKSVINLADRLKEPNRICVVYLFGTAKQEIVFRHINKINNPKVVVLWACYIEPEQIECVMNGADTIELIVKKWGLIDLKGVEIDERNPYEGNSIEDSLNEIHVKQITAIKDGRKALSEIQEQIMENGYINLSENCKAVSADAEKHIMDLFGIIQKIYPCGIEADTKQEYAYKLLHFEKWCTNGIDGKTSDLQKLGVNYDDYSQPVQLSLFDNTSWGIVEFVKEFRNVCDMEISRNGFVDLTMVFKRMQEPPFGMYQCNYYGLCIGIALQKYKAGYYVSGNLTTSKSENVIWSVNAKYIFDGFGMKRANPVYIYTQSKNQIKLAESLYQIFEPKWEVKVMCLENVLTVARSWFNDNVMYDTVQRTIPELYEILSLWEPCVCSNITEKYAEWLTEEKVEQIKRDIRNIDRNFLQMLSDKYGAEMSALYAKSQGIKGGAVGWLHSVEMVDERVEKYMKKETVCRECGAIIHSMGYEVYENGFQGNHARLTKQNIIGLNKKFLGRYQNEYFCLNCLCEFLDTDEWTLYQKMLNFKEQGCELF